MPTKKAKHIESTCTFYVEGMHCASCELLIEKELIELEGVESAEVSLKNSKVNIAFLEGKKPSLEILNKKFKKFGYKFSTKKTKKKTSPIISIQNGNLKLNSKKIKNLFATISSIVIFIGIFVAFERLQLGKHISIDSKSSIPAFFLLGVVAGLSSCTALIGGLLLTMSKKWNDLYINSTSKIEKSQPHIMFHISRVATFALLGGILGLIGESISITNTKIFAIITILVSIMMLLLALQMLEISWAKRIRIAPPKMVYKSMAAEENFQRRYVPFMIGAATFFLPCGFTLIAQTIALTSGSFFQGYLIMLSFALGTLPTLLAISYSGVAFNSKPALTAKFNIVAGLIVIFFAIYNINGQFNVLGYPSLSDISFSSNDSKNTKTTYRDTDGYQVLNITAKGFEYIPTGSMVIEAGVKTKLIVDNQGIQGCGTFMASTGLIENYVALKTGINEIDLGFPKKGTYKLTCSMGMVKPVTITAK